MNFRLKLYQLSNVPFFLSKGFFVYANVFEWSAYVKNRNSLSFILLEKVSLTYKAWKRRISDLYKTFSSLGKPISSAVECEKKKEKLLFLFLYSCDAF